MDSMVDAPAAKPAEESMQDPPPDVLDAKDEAALLRTQLAAALQKS